MTKHSLFNDIENPVLRTWNRAAMVFNIGSTGGPKLVTSYCQNFSKEDREAILGMLEEIRLNGYEKVRAYVNRSVQYDRTTH